VSRAARLVSIACVKEQRASDRNVCPVCMQNGLVIPMMRHQKMALAWMCKREMGKNPQVGSKGALAIKKLLKLEQLCKLEQFKLEYI